MPSAPTPVSKPNHIDFSRPDTNPIDLSPVARPTSMPPVPPNLPVTANGPKKVGPIVATLVVILILIIAALYFFASRINTPPVPMDNVGTTTATDQTSVKPVTNSANDPASLQSDLNASTNGLDQQNF